MRRFFIEKDDIKGLAITLSDDEAHHLRTVLRMETGTQVELFDGQGSIYTAVIETTTPQVCLTIRSHETAPETKPIVDIAQGILQGKKMDFLVQKATELGVGNILPFQSQHSTLRNPTQNKINRWQKIAFEASKQCRRPYPMEIKPRTSLVDILASQADYSLKVVLWEQEKNNTLAALPGIRNMNSLLVVIGPEGGFTTKEIDNCIDVGFIPVSMGSRTLRAETAALSIMAIVQFLAGNLEIQ
jgi:16S rRNA (uracil1498-N3)-methyltransferase